MVRLDRKTKRMVRESYLVVLTALVLVSQAARVPDGFCVFSKGDGGARTIHMVTLKPGWTEQEIRATETKVVNRGSEGGDIEVVISFDGKWLAFARSIGAPSNYGGEDYHAFDRFEVYIASLERPFPAEPIRVGRGYWPSWGDDSRNPTKTLYYSTHHDSKTIRAVTVGANGELSNDREITAIRTDLSENYVGFAMCAANGQYYAARYGGSVHAYHFAGPLAGQLIYLNSGCHPSVTAESWWVINAKWSAASNDASVRSSPIPGLSVVGDNSNESEGAYHFGSSANMEWFVTRTYGNWTIQNVGYDCYLFKLTATASAFSVEKQVRITDDGSWIDVHEWEEPQQLGIRLFESSPPSITTGSSATLTWETTGVEGVTLNGEAVPANSSRTVSPATTTTYTLVASAGDNSVSQALTLEVGAPVLTSVVVSPSPTEVMFGESVTLTAEAFDQSGDPITGSVSWSAEGGSVLPASGSTTTFTAANTAGAFTITAAAADVTGTATVLVMDPSVVRLRINSGGCSTLSVDGWEPDVPYAQGGTCWENPAMIATGGVENAAPADVYRTVRRESHNLSFDIPDGEYTVRLHFADAFGDRNMRYTIEGDVVLDNFDPATEAGSTNQAVVMEFVVMVSDGNGMQISAGSSGSDVFEAGIEICGEGAMPVSVSAPRKSAVVPGCLMVGHDGAISVTAPGEHTVHVHSADGRLVTSFSGNGPYHYVVDNSFAGQLYWITLETGSMIVTRKVAILGLR